MNGLTYSNFLLAWCQLASKGLHHGVSGLLWFLLIKAFKSAFNFLRWSPMELNWDISRTLYIATTSCGSRVVDNLRLNREQYIWFYPLLLRLPHFFMKISFALPQYIMQHWQWYRHLVKFGTLYNLDGLCSENREGTVLWLLPGYGIQQERAAWSALQGVFSNK